MKEWEENKKFIQLLTDYRMYSYSILPQEKTGEKEFMIEAIHGKAGFLTFEGEDFEDALENMERILKENYQHLYLKDPL